MVLRTMYHLVRADVLERVRRYSFLITMAVALYMGYACYDGHISMVTGNYRGIYNSAWLGTFIALTTNFFVSLAGFYIVKNAIDRDRKTGVGDILAATPINKVLYIIGKMLSNFVVLMAIVAVQMVAALIMQILKAEDLHIDLWKLYAPFLIFTAPAMAFTAAIAVLFESITWLRRGLGNVIFFFLWAGLIAIPIVNNLDALDVTSISTVQRQIQAVVLQKFPDYKGDFGINAGEWRDMSKMQTYVWDGVRMDQSIIWTHMAWFGYALALSLLAAFFFDRFDTSRMTMMGSERKQSKFRERTERISAAVAQWTSFGWISFRSPFGQMCLAEVRLMLKGISFWWYLVTLAIVIVSLSVPMDGLRAVAYPLCWLWPVLIWSKLGTREERHGTEQVIFSSPRILSRQLPAMLIAGVIVSLGIAAGALIRFAVAGDMYLVASVFIASLFVPSLAITFGVWSKSSKLFEAIYVMLWYIGPMNHVTELDFSFSTPRSLAMGMPVVYLAVCGILIMTAVAGRRKQMVI